MILGCYFPKVTVKTHLKEPFLKDISSESFFKELSLNKITLIFHL